MSSISTSCPGCPVPGMLKKAGMSLATRLLHVVGDDHDRVAALELLDQMLDRERRDRIERRAGLVLQQDLGLEAIARGAQALLLGSGRPDPRRSRRSLTSS